MADDKITNLILDMVNDGPFRFQNGRGCAATRKRDEPISIGDTVRAQVKGKRAVIGVIVKESRKGTCWVIATTPDQLEYKRGIEYNKSHCTLTSPSRARTVRPKVEREPIYRDDPEYLERIKNGLLDD